ncbi:probable serine/threonine-protein kinase DDB_G0267686 isoform X2 [Drosophila albomicans]|uniref:Probable serine/threonine-protein kinase DDB_G0267686 isoform X2 n=1 Tax=Drosophila albomicans TaxID=7291 RepID=A0A6P8W9H4_DROAB|nr:probable serine/threonine-protein kinase DDB_G0267686 isoform X2 [Drosophila albomicans]
MSRSTSVSAQYVPLLDSDKKSPRFLLNWVYDELGIQLEDLSEMKTGTIYCQLVHKLFPQVMDLKKVIFNCTLPVEIDRNFCLLHLALAKLRTFRDAAQQECIKRLTNNKFMLWFHKFYMLNKKNAEERISRKSYLLSNTQVKRSNSIVIPSKPADQQGSHKVRVAPRSQSLVNRPEMRRRNAPASSLAAEPCMMDFVSRIPKPCLTNWQKVETDSMGNIYQMLDGTLQSSFSTLASSMPKLDVNPGPPEFDTSLNEASKEIKSIFFNKLLTAEKSISQKESAYNDAPKQEELSNQNHSKQESLSNSALKLEVCSNNDASKQECLNNNAPKHEEVSNNDGPKRESPNSNNSKQESLINDAPKQASLNNDLLKQETSNNEDPKRKSSKHEESSKIDALKHEESSNKDAPKQVSLNNDASKQESSSNDALNQEEDSNNSVLKQEPSEKTARKQKTSDKVSPTTGVASMVDPRISRDHLDNIVKMLRSSAADDDGHDEAIFELNKRNNRLEEIVNKIKGYVADTSLNSNKIVYKTRKTLYLYYKSRPELDHEF